MKHSRYIALAVVALASWLPVKSLASQPVPVYLEPSERSPVVGELESLDLATPVPWPDGVEPSDGWRPVFYKGTFEVYAANRDIGKDLAPKPGSAYLLSPDNPDSKLTIATKDDEVELVSAGPSHSALRLDTVIRAYVLDETATAPPRVADQATEDEETRDPLPSSEALSREREAITDADPLRALEGNFAKTNPLERLRSGYLHKIVDREGARLAFVDTKNLRDSLELEDLVGSRILATGHLVSDENDRIVLKATRMHRRQ